jgi:sugar phosphate isomerase/epimerase
MVLSNQEKPLTFDLRVFRVGVVVALVGATWVASAACFAADEQRKLPNPFFAMDTSFHRPPLDTPQQLDLVAELKFSGVAWTEEPLAKLKESLREIESRHLKMFTIYCGAKVTPAGDITVSAALPDLMDELKGHGTIIWLHIGGKGPALDSLSDSSPVVSQLRKLAEHAEKDELRIAIYPHLGEWTAHFGDAVALARKINHAAFGVDFNLCHCLAVGDGDKIPELLDSAGPLLTVVTLNGADAGVTGGHWDKLIQPLGSGSYDVLPLLKHLRAQGYTGPIGFQGFGIKADARTILTPTIQAWQKLSVAAMEK